MKSTAPTSHLFSAACQLPARSPAALCARLATYILYGCNTRLKQTLHRLPLVVHDRVSLEGVSHHLIARDQIGVNDHLWMAGVIFFKKNHIPIVGSFQSNEKKIEQTRHSPV
jgi:hypothetical protein